MSNLLPSTSRWSNQQLSHFNIICKKEKTIFDVDQIANFVNVTLTNSSYSTKVRALVKETAAALYGESNDPEVGRQETSQNLKEGLRVYEIHDKLKKRESDPFMGASSDSINSSRAAFFISMADLLQSNDDFINSNQKRARTESDSQGSQSQDENLPARKKHIRSLDFYQIQNRYSSEELGGRSSSDKSDQMEDETGDSDPVEADDTEEDFHMSTQPSLSQSNSPSVVSMPVASEKSFTLSDGGRARNMREEIKCETTTQNMLVAFVRGVLGVLDVKMEKTKEPPRMWFEACPEHKRVSFKALIQFTSIDDGSMMCKVLIPEEAKRGRVYRRIRGIRFAVLEGKRAIPIGAAGERVESQICGEILAALYERLVFLKNIRKAPSLADVALDMTEGERTMYLLYAQHTEIIFAYATPSIDFLRSLFEPASASPQMTVNMSLPLDLTLRKDREKGAQLVGSIALRAANYWDKLPTEITKN